MDCKTNTISSTAVRYRRKEIQSRSCIFLAFPLIRSVSVALSLSLGGLPPPLSPSFYRVPLRRLQLRSTLIRLVVILLRSPFVFFFFPSRSIPPSALPLVLLRLSRTLLVRFVICYVLLPDDCRPLSYVSISALFAFACALFRDFAPNATFRDPLCEH